MIHLPCYISSDVKIKFIINCVHVYPKNLVVGDHAEPMLGVVTHIIHDRMAPRAS